MSMVDQRVDDRLGILVVDFDQHDVACFPFNECCNQIVLAAEQQVTFPVTGYGPIFPEAGRSLIDTVPVILPRCAVFCV